MRKATSEDAGVSARLAADFDAVVREYHGNIYNFVCYMIGDPEEAADLTQETFVRAYAAAQDFRGEASVKTWLSRIARNLTINRLKRQRLERETHHTSVPGEGGPEEVVDSYRDPGERLEREETRQQVRRCLDMLPPELKELLILRDFEDFSYKEMASIVNCSMEALKSRLFRARLKLREKLMPYIFPSEAER